MATNEHAKAEALAKKKTTKSAKAGAPSVSAGKKKKPVAIKPVAAINHP
jgi:hypothetical protein